MPNLSDIIKGSKSNPAAAPTPDPDVIEHDKPSAKVDATGKLSYDPESFKVPASDHNHQSTRAHFRLQIGHMARISQLVHQRRFPYAEPSDFFRHAVKFLLEYLDTLGTPSTTVWGQTQIIVDLVREQQERLKFSEIVKTLKQAINDTIGDGERKEARRLFSQVKHEVTKMPDGRWKERWLAELKEIERKGLGGE